MVADAAHFPVAPQNSAERLTCRIQQNAMIVKIESGVYRPLLKGIAKEIASARSDNQPILTFGKRSIPGDWKHSRSGGLKRSRPAIYRKNTRWRLADVFLCYNVIGEKIQINRIFGTSIPDFFNYDVMVTRYN